MRKDMSDTPRTNAYLLKHGLQTDYSSPSVEWSRTLERELAGFVRELMTEYESVSDVVLAMVELKRMKSELEALERGEFICLKCGLRKDGECEDGGF